MRQLFIKIFISLIFTVIASYVCYDTIVGSSFKINGRISTHLLFDTTNDVNVRIFCIVLTSQASLIDKGRPVVNSWAKKCDNYKLVTLLNSTNETTTIGKNVTRPSEIGDVLQPPELIIDTYEKLTDKVYLTFKYLYSRYGDQYDWYLKADDDTFIFVDHMREFLSDKNASQPVTFGYDFKPYVEGGYHSGGGGYILSREALKRIGSALTANNSYCENSGTEDVDVGLCLRSLGVYPNSSLDALSRERFHPFTIDDHYRGIFPDWFRIYAKNPIRTGLECCSDTSISFHYMPPQEIESMASIVENFQSTGRSNYSFSDIINILKH